MSALGALTAQMRACTLCQTLPLSPNPIFQLDHRARILIAGQAPGRITHHKGRPFDDPSGDRLRGWLGVERDVFYGDPRIGILPMAFCFPGGGAGGDAPPPTICAATWRKPVLAELPHIDLTLVLGAHAIAWHRPALKGGSVVQAVKATADGRGGLFILPHPSPRNNRWLKQNPWFEDTIVPCIQQRVASILGAPLTEAE